jgi:APA family basic amino acid/polyamine antiporter
MFVVAGTVLASALTVVSYASFAKVFTTVVLLSVLTAVIPYLFSVAAHAYWLLTEGRRIRSRYLLRDLAVAASGWLFSFWALAGSGYQAAYYGLFCLLLGVPVYIWLTVGRREYGEALSTPDGREFALDHPVWGKEGAS